MNSRMSRFLLTYTPNGKWNMVNTIIVGASTMKDVENNVTDVLMSFGLDLAEADKVESNKWFFVADMDGVDATVRH